MHLVYFNEKDLPVKDLETIGLVKDSKILLAVDDLKALLSGRRTGILQLQNLEDDGIKIASIAAKLSLRKNEDGKIDLLVHPRYRKAVTPDFLNEAEAQKLEKGEVSNVLKITKDEHGNKKEFLVEFDPETKEFIVSDAEKIIVPDMVNSEFLTYEQKERYRKGKEVTLADRTTFQYSASDEHGIRADKLALVASILIDGGLSYMLYKGLNALFNKKRDPKTEDQLSPGYYGAVQDLEDQRRNVPNTHSRGYSRGGASR